MSNLVMFSLPNGAEVIGAEIESTMMHIVVEQPLIIRPIQRGPNDYALDLFPHSIANPEGRHKFNRSQILSESVSVPDQFEKAYRERTSNIVIAQTLNEWEGKV